MCVSHIFLYAIKREIACFFFPAVRHIACSLVLLSSPDEISDANVKKQITVSPCIQACMYVTFTIVYGVITYSTDDHKNWKSLAR